MDIDEIVEAFDIMEARSIEEWNNLSEIERKKDSKILTAATKLMKEKASRKYKQFEKETMMFFGVRPKK